MYDKQSGCKTWTSEIRTIFNILDKREHFEGNFLHDLNRANNVFSTLTDYELWISVDAKPKLQSYKFIKQNYFTEQYVLNHLSKYERYDIFKTNRSENEYHFICICPKYAKELLIMYNSLSIKYLEFKFLTIKI